MLSPVLRRLGKRDGNPDMRFYEGLTQREIAARIGVTQMQVSRLLTRILGRLRTGVGEARRSLRFRRIDVWPADLHEMLAWDVEKTDQDVPSQHLWGWPADLVRDLPARPVREPRPPPRGSQS